MGFDRSTERSAESSPRGARSTQDSPPKVSILRQSRGISQPIRRGYPSVDGWSGFKPQIHAYEHGSVPRVNPCHPWNPWLPRFCPARRIHRGCGAFTGCAPVLPMLSVQSSRWAAGLAWFRARCLRSSDMGELVIGPKREAPPHLEPRSGKRALEPSLITHLE